MLAFPDFADSVLHKNEVTFVSRDLSNHVQEISGRIHLVHHHVLHCSPIFSHLSCHLFALEDLPWILALSSRPVRSMCLTHAVRCREPFEPMPFHRTLEPFPNCDSCDIHVLPSHEVRRGDLRALGKQGVSGDLKLRQFPFDGHLMLGIMSQECMGDLFFLLASYAHLKGVEPVFFFRLRLRHVAFVDPEHGDGPSHSPFVPEAHHSALDRHNPTPSRIWRPRTGFERHRGCPCFFHDAFGFHGQVLGSHPSPGAHATCVREQPTCEHRVAKTLRCTGFVCIRASISSTSEPAISVSVSISADVEGKDGSGAVGGDGGRTKHVLEREADTCGYTQEPNASSVWVGRNGARGEVT